MLVKPSCMYEAWGTVATCFGRWIMSVLVQDSWKCKKFSKVGFYPSCGGGLMQVFWGRLVGGVWTLEVVQYAKLGSRQVPALKLCRGLRTISD